MLKQIPGLKSPPWLQRLVWIIDPVGYLERAKKETPELFKSEVVGFGNGLVFVNRPSAIQYILSHDRQELSAPGEANGLLKPLLGDFSIVMLDGELHRRRRQLLMPAFHGERLQVYGDLIAQITIETVEKQTLDKTFLARNLTQEISLQVIMQAVFGLYEGLRYKRITELLVLLLDVFRSPISSAFLFIPSLQKKWGPWGKFLERRQELNDLLDKEIEERKSANDSKRADILSMLMSTTDEFGQSMSNLELKDELITLLFAGHETTATALAWALYWIHKEEGVKEKLLEELDSLGPQFTLIELTRLPYLNAVCNETLRIYPVAMLTFPRMAEQKIDIEGYVLEPGTIVMGCIYLLHHREEIYPNSHQFRPERFLERQYAAHEFMPFGRGARRCVGEALAQFEMKVALYNLLSNYEFALASKSEEIPKRRGVTIAPGRGVPIKVVGYHSRTKN